MADLDFTQGAGPVTVVNDLTGHQMAVNLDGSTLHRIIDGTNGGFQAKVDSQNRLHTFQSPSVGTIPIQLHYLNLTSTPIEANQWQDIFTYTVPASYNLGLTQFQLVSSQGGDDARIIQRTSFGSFNTSTGVFTDGSSLAPPSFTAELYLRVTTLIGNVNDDTVTVTYTNQAGTTGRTAAGIVKKNAVVGTNIQLTLQSPDIGVIDVTNVTHTVTQAGVVAVEGTTAIAYETAGVANIQTESVFSLNTAVIASGSSVVMQYNTSAGGAKIRRITAISNLIPI